MTFLNSAEKTTLILGFDNKKAIDFIKSNYINNKFIFLGSSIRGQVAKKNITSLLPEIDITLQECNILSLNSVKSAIVEIFSKYHITDIAFFESLYASNMPRFASSSYNLDIYFESECLIPALIAFFAYISYNTPPNIYLPICQNIYISYSDILHLNPFSKKYKLYSQKKSQTASRKSLIYFLYYLCLNSPHKNLSVYLIKRDKYINLQNKKIDAALAKKIAYIIEKVLEIEI